MVANLQNALSLHDSKYIQNTVFLECEHLRETLLPPYSTADSQWGERATDQY